MPGMRSPEDWDYGIICGLLCFLALAACDERCTKSAAHWVSQQDSVETYHRLVRDSDKRVLVELMRATGHPDDPWGVYKDGAGYGKYMDEEHAKSRALELVACQE